MSIYNKILVVADIEHEEQVAFARAIQLAKKSRSRSHISFFLPIYDFSYDMTSMLSSTERDAMRQGVIAQREEWLKELAEPYLSDDYDIDIKVVWHHRDYESIISEVYEGKHDIVIKATRQHDLLENIIFTPTDWHLLRKCPCPVLLAKNADWLESSNIIASVHVGSESETHHALNDVIIEQMLNIADRFDSSPYLVNAYPATPASVTIELPEFDPATYTNAVRAHHLTSMKALRQKHHLSEEQTVVEQGLPEEVIPESVSKLDAALVVLGTTGRTGLSAVFIGNTAEQMIDSINCDVLAIKPPGYVCPLAPKH
ncbi:universal stress protein UspE [Vibrio sp.]|nr:universal stress protein UspE [Vibrio sp.]